MSQKAVSGLNQRTMRGKVSKERLFLHYKKYYIMKRKTTRKIVFLMLLAVMLGCRQENAGQTKLSNCLIPVMTESKGVEQFYLFALVGHPAKGCPGCVQIAGELVHMDCHSHGSNCTVSSQVILSNQFGEITATTTDTFGLTSEDFFLMPDRSLSFTDENNNRIFLNIPEQMVYRDTTTLQFTFTGLFFSEGAAYSNL